MFIAAFPGVSTGPAPVRCGFLATVHPSAVIRMQREEREKALAQFTADLRKAAATLNAASRR